MQPSLGDPAETVFLLKSSLLSSA